MPDRMPECAPRVVPRQMRAVQYHRFGGPEVLEVRRASVPEPAAGEVLVRVHASGVNPKDTALRARAAAPWHRKSFPGVTGFDFAGEVADCGPGVADLSPGERVWGFLDGTRGGAAAEYVVVPREWLAPQPPTLDDVEAGALPLVASAALQALRDVAALRPGERVLIKGASGGVGLAGIQIAQALGAEVTALASDATRARCIAAGADVVLAEDEVLGAKAGYDVFLDCAGGSGIRAYGRLVRGGGRWVTVAPNLPVFILTPLSPITRALRMPRFGYLIVRPRSEDLETVGTWVTEGVLTPPPLTIFALDEIIEAHREVARRGKPGRPVLAISPEAVSRLPGSKGMEVVA